MYRPKLASKHTCTGCMVCVDACQYVALQGNVSEDGHLYVTYDSSKCIKCGKCSSVCPVVNGYKYEAADRESAPYVAWANNDELRMRSASGGVFAMLSSYIISCGGIVVGAVMNGLEVKHVLIDDMNELFKIQSSKYQQGNLSGIYQQVKARLKEGRIVLFSGTPCQVGGLYSFLAPYRFDKQLITVDVICGGFPSLLPLKALVKNISPSIIGIRSFRDKKNGWKSRGFKFSLKVVHENGETSDLGSENIVLGAFGSGLTNRYSCFNCRFAYARRDSDITIADFWGEENYVEEHYKGVSLVVVHNNAGMDLLKHADITYYPTRWADFLPKNPRMIYAKTTYLRYFPSRMFMTFLFKRCSYSFLCQLYNGKKRIFLLLPYIGVGYILDKFNTIFKHKAIKKGIKLYDRL